MGLSMVQHLKYEHNSNYYWILFSNWSPTLLGDSLNGVCVGCECVCVCACMCTCCSSPVEPLGLMHEVHGSIRACHPPVGPAVNGYQLYLGVKNLSLGLATPSLKTGNLYPSGTVP